MGREKSESKPDRKKSSPAEEQAGKILFCLAESPSIQMGLKEICIGKIISESFCIFINNTIRRIYKSDE